MLGGKSSYQAQLQLNIASVIRASQVTSVENIDEKLIALQQELIQKAHSKEAYDEIADEIFRLREPRQKTTIDTAARDEQIKRINDLQDYIAQQTTHLTENRAFRKASLMTLTSQKARKYAAFWHLILFS